MLMKGEQGLFVDSKDAFRPCEAIIVEREGSSVTLSPEQPTCLTVRWWDYADVEAFYPGGRGGYTVFLASRKSLTGWKIEGLAPCPHSLKEIGDFVYRYEMIGDIIPVGDEPPRLRLTLFPKSKYLQKVLGDIDPIAALLMAGIGLDVPG